MKKTAKKKSRVKKINPIERLKRDWKRLKPLERGNRLKLLVALGYSRRELARRLACSEGLIRQFLKLTQLPDETKSSLQQGRIGLKCALKTRQVVSPALRETPCSLSPVAPVPSIPPTTRPKQLPSLSNSPDPKVVQENAQLVVEEIRKEVHRVDRERFLNELRLAPYSIRRAEFEREAPPQDEALSGKEPREVIASCRPTESYETEFVPDRLNFLFTWFARWTQRLLPDRSLWVAVMAEASRLLHRGALPG